MTERELRTVAEGVTYLEGPRWHDGQLYFVDFYTYAVYRIGADGEVEKVLDVPQQPSGLGWLPDGRRQLLAYFLPGDLCDLKIFILKKMDHSIAAITPVRIAEIPRDTMVELVDNGSRLARAFWWSAMVSEAIEREWIVNLGQRTAFGRVGHLFCELFMRMNAVGLAHGDSCEMPLTQGELGDTTGLSTVHMNRTLQELRAQDLIILKSRRLTIPNLDRLKQACLFSSTYLHLVTPMSTI